jgi:hypothetical protein
MNGRKPMPRYIVEIPVLNLFALPPTASPSCEAVDAGAWELSKEELAELLYKILSAELRSASTFARLEQEDVKVEKIADVGSLHKHKAVNTVVADGPNISLK